MSNNEGINFNMSGLGDGSDLLPFLIFQLHHFTVIASLIVLKGHRFWIRVAQIIGKPDLAPVAWVRKLVTLCDQAPATPFDAVQLVLEKELGRSIGEVFEKFDVNPLGSASIALVYRARLKSDVEDVVVKVQHPGVQDLMITGIRNLQAFSLYMLKTYIKFDLFSVPKEMEKHVSRMMKPRHGFKISRTENSSLSWVFFTDEVDGGFGPDVMDIVTPLNWKKFARHSGSVNALLVKEFYANISKPNQHSIFMRGKQIRFTPSAINRYFYLQDVDNRHATFKNDVDSITYDEILDDLCFANTKWNGRYSVNRECLQLHAKLWNHFLKHKIMPTSHNIIVSLSRLMFLHSIMVSRPIDVGRIIVHQVHEYLGKKASALVFPINHYFVSLRLTYMLYMVTIVNSLVMKRRDNVVEAMFQEILPRVQQNFPGFPDEIFPAFNTEASPEPEKDAVDPPIDEPTPNPHYSETPEYPPTVPIEETPSHVPYPIILLYHVVVDAPKPWLDASILRVMTPVLQSPAQHHYVSVPNEELPVAPRQHYHANHESIYMIALA
ncbi:cytochrome P450 71A26-like [Hibiscus syriacus]|uniref:Cytochrome P450 71A26-like n=1 Tax=Hibiscus syriacus TaxID=106335 RepID=A0A6A3CG93_HIBSY|nr:cytochrome P450 71A26-like [Hibiscus syriacus]